MLLLLDPYVDVILALALAYLALKIVQALFGPLGGIPVVGSKIVALEHAIAQSIASACGSIVHPVDVAVGRSLAGVAGLVNRAARFFRDTGGALLGVSALTVALAEAYHAIRAVAHSLHSRFAGIESGVKSLEREFHGIEHRVKTLEHEVTKGIGHDLRIGLAQTEKEVAHIEHRVIPSLRTAEADAEHAISNLYDWIRGKADILGAGTFVGAVTAVLSLVGLDWLACRSRSNVNGKSGCALWNDLEALLQTAIIGAEIASLAELIAVAQKVTPDVVSGAEKLLDV